MTGLRIRVSSIRPGNPRERDRGLLAYVTVVLDGRLRLDGITLRRDSSGAVSLSYPERADGAGKRHALIWPLDDETRTAVLAAVLQALNPGKAGAA